MDSERRTIAYWDERARRWRVAAPLSPGADDVRYYEERARAAAHGGESLQALLLGATPVIGAMAWPRRAQVIAVDWSGGMFTHVWHGPAAARCAAVRANWCRLPVGDGALDFAVGDGCYSTFAHLDGVRALNRELARVLRPGGEACIRCFTRPERPDTLEALFEGLAQGRYPNLDVFRWLVAMALHGDRGEGVALRSVWEAWHAHVPDAEAHPARASWSADALANIEGWHAAVSRYVFPTVAELRAAAAANGFDVVACDLGGYEWAERFPRLALRRRAA